MAENLHSFAHSPLSFPHLVWKKYVDTRNCYETVNPMQMTQSVSCMMKKMHDTDCFCLTDTHVFRSNEHEFGAIPAQTGPSIHKTGHYDAPPIDAPAHG